MLYWGVILAFAVGFGTVMYLTPKLLLLSLRKHIVDPVGNRKIHTTAASRMGGVSFFPALLLAVGLSISLMYFIGFRDFPDGFFGRSAGVFGALLMLYALGVRDDMADVAYQKKFLVQFLASAVVVSGGVWVRDLHGVLGIGELPACVGMPLTVFLLIFVTNAINLIDGIDGLAAALSILALAVYGTLFLADAQLFDALLVFAALGALLPFFYYNVFSIRRKNGSKIF
ncbi:undecaprenyl/decaprenyl-phosphate alpha-N-acetylglucosaminyl 1-phosphate transferase, partial [Alistipes sp. OttesenSCG-928-L06]|nr:undecaprenyl/decaprenyl-phosphate alpha-N-acetylglucosaminyl 1-phosphate transferase [Alistipes sp. OttesenSCG-928-L06]